MLKIEFTWVRSACFVGLLLGCANVAAAFNTTAARTAIDSFKQELSTAQISTAASSLAALDAQLQAANTSVYMASPDLSAAVTKAKSDVEAMRSLLSNPPTQADVTALESAYTAYVTGIESSKLQVMLAGLQADSDQALKAATAAVQDVIAAFKTAQGLVVVSASTSQPKVS